MTAQPLPEVPVGLTAVEHAQIVERARELILIPTRGGLDDYRPAVETVSHRLTDAGLPFQILRDGGQPLGIAATLDFGPGPHYVLDAPLDTADIGDRDAWSRYPFSGELEDGWLHGRGAADCKIAVAMFTHLAGRLVHHDLRGRLTILFDLDEHTGGFGGIKAWLAGQDRPPDGVMIGYPGPDKIVVGGRGVWRARITIHGEAAHSGASKDGTNAVVRAAELAGWLTSDVPYDVDTTLGLPPKATVTAFRGGAEGAFSVVPDRAEMEIDVRLTTTFTAAEAEDWVRTVVKGADWQLPSRPTVIEPVGDPWPAYRLPDDHALVRALQHGAAVAGLNPTPAVAGPSNIGCYLSQHGIPATAGFGVRYRGLHAANEAIEVASIPAVYAAYFEAVRELLV